MHHGGGQPPSRGRYARQTHLRLGELVGHFSIARERAERHGRLEDRVRTLTSEATGERLAARTVLHVYRTLARAFKHAERDELIPKTPCSLNAREGDLPRKRDKDPTWRATAVYTRAETETLLSHPDVPLDRRVYYAMMLLGGLRSAEAAGHTWRDYDAAAEPLGRLLVATQADGRASSRETKTGETRDVPVHPALAKLLEEWRREGFPRRWGRHPSPDHPIVPNRGDRTGRSFTGKHALERVRVDCERIGLRQVPHGRHAMRSTFLTLLEVDGANMAIARRATHAAPAERDPRFRVH